MRPSTTRCRVIAGIGLAGSLLSTGLGAELVLALDDGEGVALSSEHAVFLPDGVASLARAVQATLDTRVGGREGRVLAGVDQLRAQFVADSLLGSDLGVTGYE